MEVLVIGLGSMGKRRIRLLKKFEQVTGIIGIDQCGNRRKEICETSGCRVYESIEEAMEKHPDIENAFICTSPLSHNKLIREMLNNDLNVFTEINLVSDGYEANMKLAEEKGKILFLSSTFYYREEIQYIRKSIADKDKLNYIYHIGQYLPDWHPWESYKDFFVSDKRTNGCREIMAIELPWLIGTFGKVKKMNVLADHMSGLTIQYRDNYMIQLEHANGNKGVLVVDIVSPKAVRNLEIYGENLYYAWNGSPAGLEYFDAETKKMRKAKLCEDVEHIDGYGAFIVENAYGKEIKAFFDSVYNGMSPQYGFAEDLETLKLIDRIEAIDE